MVRQRDIALAQTVQAHLGENQHLSSFPIKVAAKDGTVYLSGWVDTSERRREVELVASGTIGVREVINQVVPEPERRIVD